MEASYHRHDISDEVWALLEPHLPGQRGKWGGIAQDGGVWDGSPREAYWLNWLEDRPFTTFFVDGNHENFDELNALPVHTWHGGKVHYVRPHEIGRASCRERVSDNV